MRLTPVHRLAVAGVAVAALYPRASVATATRASALDARIDWSRRPPGGFAPTEVPQFVAITSDDNFGNEQPAAVGGVKEYVRFMQPLRNADGTPARGTFFHTTMYYDGNRESWLAARRDRHETAVHTRRHQNGGLPGIAGMSSASCCRPQHFSVQEWIDEIGGARSALIGDGGLGAASSDIVGHRAPFLAYSDAMFAAMSQLGLTYDSSIPNCFGQGEDGRNCSWPHTLHEPSRDALTMEKTYGWAPVGAHPGLWEVSPTTLVVPDDSLSLKYGFRRGLRARIEGVRQRQGTLPYPTVYDAATGRVSGLDYSLLVDLMVAPGEMLAIYKHTLDLHLAGNRAPFIVLSHAFLYAYEGEANAQNTATLDVQRERWEAFTAFVRYANSKPEVRLRPVNEIVEWMQHPMPLR